MKKPMHVPDSTKEARRREAEAFKLCECGRCLGGTNAPEEWCPPVYRHAFDIELRRARVLAKLDSAATRSQRHGDIYADIAAVYRAHLATIATHGGN